MKGYSLIELIMTLVLLGILTWVGIAVMLSGTDAYIFFNQRKDILSDARLGLDRMSREIRMIKDTTSIITANQETFSFIDTSDTAITFTLSSGVVNRIANGVTNSLLGNVNSLTFTYYDSSDNPILSAIVAPSNTNVRRIRIDINMSSASSNTVNIQSDVWPRNLI